MVNSTLTNSPARLPWFLDIKLLKELSKSGIVTLVLISVLGGFFISHSFERHIDWLRFTLTFFGVLFLASGSSALNQVQDQAIDLKMPRTASRPLPSGRMSTSQALFFCGVTIALGLVLLALLDLSLFVLGLIALLSYNVLYTLWWKRNHAFGAVPGAIPGALPILMGSIGATGNWKDPGGWYLFSILFFWQMPHFWTLAIKYRSDYADGGIPTLPVEKGVAVTIRQIQIWCLAYVAISLSAPLFFRVGALYLSCTLVVGVMILKELYQFSRAPESKAWLRFFLWINLTLIVYLGALAVDQWSIHLIPGFKNLFGI
ncbi:MAG: protoheme IX farnesyltransferase [Proteobacteria bacterium]|nr:MAG: protoheme IX farnesyltransferase [Pseudomonadota bacterium]